MGGVGTTATAGGNFCEISKEIMQAAARLGTDFFECGSWVMIYPWANASLAAGA